MSVARDIAIIILAVESIIIGALLVFLIIQIQRLIKLMRHEIKPILDSTNETVSTVRGTATFLSDHLVSPMVKISSFFSGVRRSAQVLTGWPKRGESSPADAPPAGNDHEPAATTETGSFRS